MNPFRILLAFLYLFAASLMATPEANAFTVENRVGDFFLGTLDHAEENASQAVELHREKRPIHYDSTSGYLVAANNSRKFWTKSTNFKDIKVFQRNDIFDPSTVSTWKVGGKKVTGTNLERMASGRAPIGVDGKPVNLHHLTQGADDAVAELTQTFHQQNSSIIHINPNSIPSGIDRSAFNAWKSEYWINRASTYSP